MLQPLSMRNLLRLSCIFVLLLSTILFSGCEKIEQAEIKMGWKNLDFEYMKNNKVDKIIIQSKRDPSFKFTVTDERTIEELYDILSAAKEVPHKTALDPDYIFEIHEGDIVHKFNYITGIDKDDDYGNLYSENKVFLVSQRIDNDIIRNLWNLTKPREFEETYYGSLFEFFEKYSSNISKNSTNIGLDISQDTDVAKYMFSTDIQEFKEKLKKNYPNVTLIYNDDDKNADKCDVIINVKTSGYKTTIYKAILTVTDKKDKSETKYYISNKYENNDWTKDISDKKTDGF